MENTSHLDFDEALAEFIVAAQSVIDQHYRDNYKNLTAPTLTTEPGVKYVRVVTSDSNQRSVFCFVRKVDGAVLKAASWSAPAKTARGSIYNNNGRDAITAYGAKYLRS